MSELLSTTKRPPSTAAQQWRRSGKNINGYSGDTIELDAVLADCERAALAANWTVEEFNPAPRRLVAFKRLAQSAASNPRRLYISTGIHGDEPAGPLAVRRLLHEDVWPAHLEVWLCPCLNPLGFSLNRRENPEGLDLNRQYLHSRAEEVRAHIAWLEHQPRFDLCLCLHEDWEAHGFYLYELNPENHASLAETIIGRVAEVCPIDHSNLIEGRPAQGGIIRPSTDPLARPQWPEAFYLLTHKTRLSYTLEAPSDYPLSVRVAALTAAVSGILSSLSVTPRA